MTNRVWDSNTQWATGFDNHSCPQVSSLGVRYVTANHWIQALSYISLTHANVWESMGKPCSCMQFIKRCNFLLQVTWELVSVLQVTQESVSGTTSHRHVSERNWRFMWWNHYHLSTKLHVYGKMSLDNLLLLALLLVLHTHNDTDSNKHVILSGIALYCGDNYILSST